MSEMPIRVALVDDHELIRSGLRGVLDADPGIAVVAEASNGDQAVAAVEVHRPDVVIMDLQMPGMGGIEATRRVTDARPGTAVLVLTMFDDDDSVFAAVQAGARGYLLKGAGREDVRAAVRAVHLGHATFGPGVANRILDRVLLAPDEPEAFPSLTSREREVLEALADGHEPDAIARRLGISEKTVRNNISSVLTKLQVIDRVAAVALAREAGMGGRPQRRRRVILCAQVTDLGELSTVLDDEFPAFLRTTSRLIDQAVIEHAGSPFGSVGSSRCAWFHDVECAVEAAADAVHAAAAVSTADMASSIRVGIHIGEVEELDGELIGVVLHEAAAVAGAAFNGQILISAEALPAGGITGHVLTEVGPRELREIDRPLPLYEIEAVAPEAR